MKFVEKGMSDNAYPKGISLITFKEKYSDHIPVITIDASLSMHGGHLKPQRFHLQFR